MPSVTFDLETVTPLFLGGAEQDKAELRPPAFRGALRYWFRAIAGGIIPLSVTQNWEKKIFGSTENGGAIIIRVQAKEIISHKCLTKDDEFSGLNYLFFSLYKNARGCFPPGTCFKIILQTRLQISEHIDYLKLVSGAMLLFVYLGGIGSRSNRGGGNLKVNLVTARGINLDDLNFKITATNLENFKTRLNKVINQTNTLYQQILNEQSTNITTPTLFDILHSDTAEIFLWQAEELKDNEEWDYILDNFGRLYQQFRQRYQNARTNDYPQVKNWIRQHNQNNEVTVTTVKRAAFGLPIQFYFTSLPKENRKATLEGQYSNRSSSPFHIRVIQLANNDFVIILIKFRTQLLPNAEKLRLKKRGSTTLCQVPNQNIIDEFLETLQNLQKVDY